MNNLVAEPFFRRVALLGGVLAVAAVAVGVMSDMKPSPPATPIDAPLRSPLASLPDAMGDWTRATDAEGEPMADQRLPEGAEACTGTRVWLGRRVARDGRSAQLHVEYHSGATLRSGVCTPERSWEGYEIVSPLTRVQLSSGLEVMLVEFEQHPSGGRHLAAYTFLFDGKRRAERDTPGLARSHWTKVQLDARFPREEAETARRTFLADVEDLMPRVVSELQDTCLPLPVAAVPTG